MTKNPTKKTFNIDYLLQAALSYAELGWSVFPLTGKKPLIKGGFNSASTDPAQIKRWWLQDFPGANIGVACNGKFWALDLDLKTEGDKTLYRLESEYGELPLTVRSITGGGGSHYLFKHTNVPIKNGANTAGRGLDTRSDGYIVLPPSVHPDTRGRYEWALGFSPNEIEIGEAPSWLVKLCAKTSAKSTAGTFPTVVSSSGSTTQLGRKILEAVCGKILLAPEGEQESTLNASAYLIGRFVGSGQLEQVSAESALTTAGISMPSFNPSRPWAPQEIEVKVRAAMTDGIEAPLRDFFRDSNGKVIPSNQANVRLALNYLGVNPRYDQFNDRLLIESDGGAVSQLDDNGLTDLWLMIDEEFKFRPKKDFFADVVGSEARNGGFHPIREYFDSLKWDGKCRVDEWLINYAGADPSSYVRAVGALVLVAAVRRVRSPGSKFDEMLILEGEQGTGKSTALKIMAIKNEWFSDDLPLGLDAQKTIERTRGKLIVEAGELRGMKKNDVESLKAFLSRTSDRARRVYGHLTEEVPRQFIIVGTTNSDKYLRDSTGNRRFLPVKTKKFDLKALKRDRNQLWAEALVREREGVSTRLDRKYWNQASREQAERFVEDPLVAEVREKLGEMEGAIHGDEALKLLGIPAGSRTQEHNNRLGEAMKAAGWDRKRKRYDGKQQYYYCKGKSNKRIIVSHDGVAGYKIPESSETPM